MRARPGYGTYSGATTWPHNVALGVRSGVNEQKQFAESVFKIDFLYFLKLKCTLHKIAKSKIIYSSTTSAKAVRVFDH
jgi:hypothetical protein